MPTPNSNTPAVVVEQVDHMPDGSPCTPWTAFSYGQVELDLSADGTGCIAMLDTTITFASLAQLAQIRALAALLSSPEVQAALQGAIAQMTADCEAAATLERWFKRQFKRAA